MGRPTKEGKQQYNYQIRELCGRIKEVKSTLDFPVSSRGWCYLLEEYGLSKGDFDRMNKIINDCRKSGMLPLDICAEDSTRAIEGIADIHDPDVEDYAADLVYHVMNDIAEDYRPYSFTDFQDYYIEVLVEKIDLKGMFKPVCNKYHVPYANSKGWADINSRAALMERFKEWQDRGKQCVLLYCGDHDPGGLIISDTIRTNLNDLSDAIGWSPDNIIIERFGLNYDFIEANGITWIENLHTSAKDKTDEDGKKVKAYPLNDPRHKDHFKSYVQNYLNQYGVRKVEANALVTRVDAGRKLCEDAILKYIDLDGKQTYERVTSQAREELQAEIIKQIGNQ